LNTFVATAVMFRSWLEWLKTSWRLVELVETAGCTFLAWLQNQRNLWMKI
jgi:hypothetical protein